MKEMKDMIKPFVFNHYFITVAFLHFLWVHQISRHKHTLEMGRYSKMVLFRNYIINCIYKMLQLSVMLVQVDEAQVLFNNCLCVSVWQICT